MFVINRVQQYVRVSRALVIGRRHDLMGTCRWGRARKGTTCRLTRSPRMS